MCSNCKSAVFEYMDNEARKFPEIHCKGDSDINIYIAILSKLLNVGIRNIQKDNIPTAYILLLRCCLISTYDLNKTFIKTD